MRTPLAAMAALALSSIVAAQSWREVFPSTTPPPRFATTSAYDSVRGSLVIFGGMDVLGGLRNDTWEWDGTNWSEVVVTAPPPPPFIGLVNETNLVFDAAHARMILFVPGTTAFGDTWSYDGLSWSLLNTTHAPTRRRRPGMAYDSARRVVLLWGGNDGLGYLNDLWSLDGLTWTPLAVSTPPPPVSSLMVFDDARGRVVLVQAAPSGTDLWEYDGVSWDHPNTSVAPPPVSAISYRNSTRTVIAKTSDATWQWDGNAWTDLNAPSPVTTQAPGLVYDQTRDQLVLFSSDYSASPPGMRTWLLDSPPVFPTGATPFGAGCGSPTLGLTTIAPPRSGTLAEAQITNTPTPFTFVALGWNRTVLSGIFPLPLDLTSFGMPGCTLLQSSDVAAEPTTPTGSGTSTFRLQIPSLPALLGLTLYLQGWSNAPGANAGNTIVSNGVEWVIGNQ